MLGGPRFLNRKLTFQKTMQYYNVCVFFITMRIWQKHCGQLICRKISLTGPTSCQILRLKCTKFDFCWGCPQEPAGEVTALPQCIVYLWGLLLRVGRAKGRGRGGRDVPVKSVKHRSRKVASPPMVVCHLNRV